MIAAREGPADEARRPALRLVAAVRDRDDLVRRATLPGGARPGGPAGRLLAGHLAGGARLRAETRGLVRAARRLGLARAPARAVRVRVHRAPAPRSRGRGALAVVARRWALLGRARRRRVRRPGPGGRRPGPAAGPVRPRRPYVPAHRRESGRPRRVVGAGRRPRADRPGPGLPRPARRAGGGRRSGPEADPGPRRHECRDHGRRVPMARRGSVAAADDAAGLEPRHGRLSGPPRPTRTCGSPTSSVSGARAGASLA